MKRGQFCPVCHGRNLRKIYRQDDYNIIGCGQCGFGWLNHPPSAKQLADIYQEDYHDYISEADFAADAQKKFDLIKQYLRPRFRVLDYGCGFGAFLSPVRDWGCQVQGYDISNEAATKARQRLGINVKTQRATETLFPQKSFDVITGFDVIEHILDWPKVLRWWRKWLKPGGYIFMTTPSLDAWDAKLLQHRWYGFTRIPQHVNYFTRESLRLGLTDAGFRVQQFKTWGFVRSINYLLSRLRIKPLPMWGNKQIYLPMTDVMVIARA